MKRGSDLAASEIDVVMVIHSDMHQGLEPIRLGDAVGRGQHPAAANDGSSTEGAHGDLLGLAVVVLEVDLPRVLVDVGVLAVDDAVACHSLATWAL